MHLLSPIRTLLALVAFLALARPAPAAPIVVKMATLAPEGTSWYNGLRKLGERWNELSDGQVELKIYAGGVAGNEGVMVRKMRIGQLHGAALSNLGLLDIDSSAQVINAPMLIEDYDELDYVMEQMTPLFERRLEAEGFKVLNWGDAGWAYFFSKEPVITPADIKDLKVYVWEGDPNAVVLFRKAGFNPVVVASTDMVPSLQSGLITAFPHTPLAALSLQWFALAPHMLDVPWGPLVGATVLTSKAWERIPEPLHEPFIQAAQEIGGDLQQEIRRQDQKAITVMKKYGLEVHHADEAARKEWEALAESMYPFFRTRIVEPEVFDKARAAVRAHRAQE